MKKDQKKTPDELPPGWDSRTRLLLGDEAMASLASATVCVVGSGAVGGYAVEGLARAGIGNLRVVDFDVLRESNMNRQILALRSTLGRPKAGAAAERVRDINPGVRVDARQEFASAETMPSILEGVDLLVDAVDSVTPKVDVIEACARAGVPVYSSLGAATRRDADAIRFAPLFSSRGCPLGSQIRKRLRRRGVTEGDLWCVYSEEDRNMEAIRAPEEEQEGAAEYRRGRARSVLGSLPTITALFGLRLAHEAILRLTGKPQQ